MRVLRSLYVHLSPRPRAQEQKKYERRIDRGNACAWRSHTLAAPYEQNTHVSREQADKLQSLISAAKVPEIEPIWTTLFAKALEGKDVKDLLMNVGSGGGAAPAAGGAAAGGASGSADAPAAEEKAEEGKSYSIQ
jgi:large subunit ribosomal protein LP1